MNAIDIYEIKNELEESYPGKREILRTLEAYIENIEDIDNREIDRYNISKEDKASLIEAFIIGANFST